jgi:dGTPase
LLERYRGWNRKKLVKFEDFIAEIQNSLKGEALTYWENLVRDAEENKSTIKKFIYIRTNLITRSAKVATKTFFENEESILSGCFYQSLINKTSSEYQILKAVRSYVALNVYTSREAEIIELSGNSIITGLLEKLSPLLEIGSKEFKLIQSRDRDGIKEYGLDLHSRLFNLLPSQCIKSYAGDTDDRSAMEWICRSHMIIDYISGMTDDFALEMYQKLMGIRTV